MKYILWKLFTEALSMVTRKLAREVVSERFMSRIVCYGLRSIADKTTNDLTKEMAEAFITALQRSDLPELK